MTIFTILKNIFKKNKQSTKYSSKMKPITKEDLLTNRFIKWTNKDHTTYRVHKLTKEEALKLQYRTLCIYAGVESLSFRGVEGAVKNANHWLERKTKKDFIYTWFE